VNCNDNSGIGFNISVDECIWAGTNPGYSSNPLWEYCQFQVSAVTKGVPIYDTHSIKIIDWSDGTNSYQYT
jgi:hypothetical protein